MLEPEQYTETIKSFFALKILRPKFNTHKVEWLLKGTRPKRDAPPFDK